MTINGSTNNVAWTYKLEVQEISTSVLNRTSTIQVDTYLGRASSRSYVGGRYENSVSITGATPQTTTASIPANTYINGGEWLHLQTFTFVVPNTENPTNVTISSTMTSSIFTPSYSSASGNMQLTILHLNPEIGTATMVEFNSKLIGLNVPDTTVVTNLSQKRITINTTTYDDAVPTYRLENYNTNYNLPITGNYQGSNIFNADYKRNPVFVDTNGKAKIVQKVKDSLNGTASSWLYVDINGQLEEPNAILYTEPIIERTSTNIKRKSGVYSETLQRIANLTDNIVSLNLKGNIYKGNDIVGNNNSIIQIGYKIWSTDDTEPQDYTSLSSSTTIDSSGNITISDFEIANILFTKVYNYKIIIKDFYNKEVSIDNGVVPTGQPVWSEYSDHVDFLELSVKGYNPFEYSETETICGIWIDDKPIYRKVFIDTLPSTTSWTNIISLSNINSMIKIYGYFIGNDGRVMELPHVETGLCVSLSYQPSQNAVQVRQDSTNWYGSDYYIILEYTKTSD